MLYNEFQGMKLSALGMGCMRLPVIDGKEADIDVAATQEMVDYAMASGVNYYDTAWGYHDGHSAPVMGECLSKYSHDNYYLANKFPGYDLNNMDKVEAIFEQQIIDCRVDYFDFYLIHNVCEMNINEYLDPKYGIFDYLWKQKQAGRIKHLGFSAHGRIDCMKRFLEAYGEHMEFCQIQLNWFDWDFQDAKGKMELLREWNIPVWVMEPVRGGMLAKLSPENEAKLRALRPDEDIPAWSFRFLQTLPDVCVTLSGMSDIDQMKANIDTYKDNKPLNDTEMSALMEVAANIASETLVPCTKCHYCTSHCPQELDIPLLLDLLREHRMSDGHGFLAPMLVGTLPEDKRPSACLACRSCEAVCPQQIKISEKLAEFNAMLNK